MDKDKWKSRIIHIHTYITQKRGCLRADARAHTHTHTPPCDGKATEKNTNELTHVHPNLETDHTSKLYLQTGDLKFRIHSLTEIMVQMLATFPGQLANFYQAHKINAL